ncbi:Integral membrane [Coniochaeta hoffmannii]|uniref:Integral membrane n=1 Tax=Coniochaeta hoffmannii TaxID=91930 RepID=A0AA38RRL3_9PEZI|nr:Integral membrane [Coniochaeta hoffmannii]
MPLYSDPPPLRPFQEDKPTLLVCWWITLFCTVIILLRVGGRFVRSERLFREDKVAALALIPLYLRMGAVHVILMYGTNNVQLAGAHLSEKELRDRRIGSGLVLLSRILYAATLWTLKNTILEFFRRLNITWQRSYQITLNVIRCTLVATFVAVVISDLAECHPFSHNWQVVPDPGGKCRQGYGQLLTMAVCNVFTDLLLVIFPIPVIVGSGMTLKRKVQLILLFSLSLAPVTVTLYRVPHIIDDHGSQATRSLYASVELLFATAAANALVLGSFVRDRGVKKKRFKYGSVAAGSMERSSGSNSRRPTLNKHWGSLEDLARDTGFGVVPELRESDSEAHDRLYTPAPTLTPTDDMNNWHFPGQKRTSTRSDDSLLSRDQPPSAKSNWSNSNSTPRKVSFFDVGGLLDEEPISRQNSHISSDGGPLSSHSLPSPSVPASGSGFRRGSTAFLQDIGGLLSPAYRPAGNINAPKLKTATELQPIRSEPESPYSTPSPTHRPSDGMRDLVLHDPGGLLNTNNTT